MSITKRTDGGPAAYQATDRTRGFKSFSKTFESKADAKEWLAKIKAERRRGYDPQPMAKMSLRQALEWYLETITPEKAGHHQERNRGKQLLRLPLMDLGLAAARPQDFRAYAKERQKAGTSGSTIRKELSLLSQVYVRVKREFQFDSLKNPLEEVKGPPCAPPRTRRLSEDLKEEERLLAHFKARGNPEMRFVVSIAVETGLRKSELLRLRWRDIRWGTAPWATVEQARKGRVTRVGKEYRGVPLTSRAVEELTQLRALQENRVMGPLPEHAPVFTMTASAIDNARAKALKATGIEDWRLHDARHEAASRLYVRGLKQEFIRRILGHRSLKMTEGYQDFLEKEMSDAMKEVEEAIGNDQAQTSTH